MIEEMVVCLYYLFTTCLFATAIVRASSQCVALEPIAELDEGGSDYAALALSGDGSTLATSSHYTSAGQHVRVYRLHHNRSWTQVGSDILAEEINLFGRSVALSHDGTTVASGSSGNNINPPSGRVLRFWNGNWVQLGVDLRIGRGVALSADGDTVAAGNAVADPEAVGSNRGIVRVYRYDLGSSNWVQYGENLVGENDYDLFGDSVSLSADGTIVASVSEQINRNPNANYARVFQFTESRGWIQLGTDILSEDSGDAIEGGSGVSGEVSLSADGYTLAVTNPRQDGNGAQSGHVRVFQYDSNRTDWVQKGSTINGIIAEAELGGTVSLSADGMTLAVSTSKFSDRKYVQVYHFKGDWEQVGTDILIPNGEPDRVALSCNGAVVAAGDSSEGHTVLLQTCLNRGIEEQCLALSSTTEAPVAPTNHPTDESSPTEAPVAPTNGGMPTTDESSPTEAPVAPTNGEMPPTDEEMTKTSLAGLRMTLFGVSSLGLQDIENWEDAAKLHAQFFFADWSNVREYSTEFLVTNGEDIPLGRRQLLETVTLEYIQTISFQADGEITEESLFASPFDDSESKSAFVTSLQSYGSQLGSVDYVSDVIFPNLDPNPEPELALATAPKSTSESNIVLIAVIGALAALIVGGFLGFLFYKRSHRDAATRKEAAEVFTAKAEVCNSDTPMPTRSAATRAVSHEETSELQIPDAPTGGAVWDRSMIRYKRTGVNDTAGEDTDTPRTVEVIVPSGALPEDMRRIHDRTRQLPLAKAFPLRYSVDPPAEPLGRE